MLERDGQVAQLQGLLGDVVSNGGRVVLVRGEAGIGKTVLVDQFLREVKEPSVVHVGVCDDLATPQPLAPLWDLARDHDDLASALASNDRRGAMTLLQELLRPEVGAAVLVLEDTQWADDATLDVITFLGRRIRRTSGLLVLTYRDGAVDVDHPLRRVIGDLPPADIERIRLLPLSVGAVAELAGEHPERAEELVALTGGNPLFVTEVLAAGTAVVPTSVRAAVLSRVARLSGPGRDLVATLSIVPGRVEWALLVRLVDGHERLLLAATREGLLDVRDDGVAFRHELQRRAVEASLPAGERRRRHREVLAALGDDADSARLAHHARLAHDTEALLVHAPRAGRTALAVRSHREALSHFEAVGPYLDRLPADVAADVAADWAQAAVHADAPEATTAVRQAVALRRAAGDPVALARTLASGLYGLALAGDREEARAWADEAVALAQAALDSDALAHALTEQGRLLMVESEDQAGSEAVTRAISIAEQTGDQRTLASAMILQGLFDRRLGFPAGRETMTEAGRRAARAGHGYEETDAQVMLGFYAAWTEDDLDQARTHLDRARELAEAYDYDELAWFVRAFGAVVAMWTGDWTRATDEASEILAALPAQDAQGWAQSVLATVAVRRGHRDADEEVARMWEIADRMGAPYIVGAAGAVVAEHAWITGVLDEGQRDVIRLAWLGRDRANPATDDFAFWRWMLHLTPDVPLFTLAGYDRLVRGDVSGSVDFWAARGQPYHAAVALVHGGDDDVVEAVHRFEMLGAEGAARRLRADLRDRGVTVRRGPSRSVRDHPAGLTERQAEVLAFLADGWTNSAIADHLFLSPRTVENHVAALLRKLDVADREAAVAEALDRGLLAEG